MRNLNHSQRVVMVVALGAALYLLGGYVCTRGTVGGGWFGYFPTQSLTIERPGALVDEEGALLVWAGLLGLWTVTSIWLFGRRAPRD